MPLQAKHIFGSPLLARAVKMQMSTVRSEVGPILRDRQVAFACSFRQASTAWRLQIAGLESVHNKLFILNLTSKLTCLKRASSNIDIRSFDSRCHYSRHYAYQLWFIRSLSYIYCCYPPHTAKLLVPCTCI